MRLGINGNLGHKNPQDWLEIIKRYDLRAAIAPMKAEAPPDERAEYLRLAAENDIVIGEVGIWKNVMEPDEKKRRENIAFSCRQLAFADEIGARCCVNISGAAGPVWDGYYAESYERDFYTRIIDTTREIIDEVKPKRTSFTFEPMYWMHPDSPDDYLRMLRDIDRPAAGVHMDYVNMINGFEKYHNCEAFITECFKKLGPRIKSVHAKDVRIGPVPPICLTETIPGTGRVRFGLVLRLAHELDADMPVFVEHLSTMEEYDMALRHLKQEWAALKNGSI